LAKYSDDEDNNSDKADMAEKAWRRAEREGEGQRVTERNIETDRE
jgi:hypothetical protein